MRVPDRIGRRGRLPSGEVTARDARTAALMAAVMAAVMAGVVGVAAAGCTPARSGPEPTASSTRFSTMTDLVPGAVCAGIITTQTLEAILPGSAARARELNTGHLDTGYGQCVVAVPEGDVVWFRSEWRFTSPDGAAATPSGTTSVGGATSGDTTRVDGTDARRVTACKPTTPPSSSAGAPPAPAGVEQMVIEVRIAESAPQGVALTTLDHVTERLRAAARCTLTSR